jgi:hypothetical protein
MDFTLGKVSQAIAMQHSSCSCCSLSKTEPHTSVGSTWYLWLARLLWLTSALIGRDRVSGGLDGSPCYRTRQHRAGSAPRSSDSDHCSLYYVDTWLEQATGVQHTAPAARGTLASLSMSQPLVADHLEFEYWICYLNAVWSSAHYSAYLGSASTYITQRLKIVPIV